MRVGCSLLALLMTFPGCGKWTSWFGGHSPPPSEGLAVGQLAPEIDGEDLNGVPFKLSDYRGRVVVLDFWGDW